MTHREMSPLRVTALPIALLGALILALAGLPQVWYPPWFDQGAFAACGQILNAGGVFLRDCWDVRGPLTHMLYAFALRIAPHTGAVFALNLFWQGLGAVLLGALSAAHPRISGAMWAGRRPRQALRRRRRARWRARSPTSPCSTAIRPPRSGTSDGSPPSTSRACRSRPGWATGSPRALRRDPGPPGLGGVGGGCGIRTHGTA